MKTYNRKKAKEVKPYVGADGRMKVYLVKDGVGKEEDLARLVACSFPDIVGEPKEGLPMFKDGNYANCSADNLFWK